MQLLVPPHRYHTAFHPHNYKLASKNYVFILDRGKTKGKDKRYIPFCKENNISPRRFHFIDFHVQCIIVTELCHLAPSQMKRGLGKAHQKTPFNRNISQYKTCIQKSMMYTLYSFLNAYKPSHFCSQCSQSRNRNYQCLTPKDNYYPDIQVNFPCF